MCASLLINQCCGSWCLTLCRIRIRINLTSRSRIPDVQYAFFLLCLNTGTTVGEEGLLWWPQEAWCERAEVCKSTGFNTDWLHTCRTCLLNDKDHMVRRLLRYVTSSIDVEIMHLTFLWINSQIEGSLFGAFYMVATPWLLGIWADLDPKHFKKVVFLIVVW